MSVGQAIASRHKMAGLASQDLHPAVTAACKYLLSLFFCSLVLPLSQVYETSETLATFKKEPTGRIS
jgi:hypothetical protein